MAVERLRARFHRKAWRTQNLLRWRRKPRFPANFRGSGLPSSEALHNRSYDAADQLRIVMGAEFSSQPLLNRSEVRVLKALERFVHECDPRWQVMAQVSLGEIVTSKDSAAYACINSKRVDLLLVDGDCLPRHAIEYQGHGHHQGNAAARDAVKKEALRRAGIGYHEVVARHTTPAELRMLIEKLVVRSASTAASGTIMPAPRPFEQGCGEKPATPAPGSA
jgi:hypothetical protein